MMQNLLFLFSFSVLISACSSSEKADAVVSNEVKRKNPICFNHAVLVLDSATYYEVVNSEFIKQFAFSEERQLNGYKGFYLFGKTNYIELFHPKSFDGYKEEVGGMWINLVPLKANYINNLNWKNLDFVTYESNDHYYDLSLIVGDSINPIATWEMTKEHYESRTKKEYSDSMDFLPVDYNSLQDSDSSSNYLMSDVKGIGIRLNPDDSLAIVSYLNVIGFDDISEQKGFARISNNDQFIELHLSSAYGSPTINRFYIQLNKSVTKSNVLMGNSRIECEGKQAIWYFE
ncbi:MAG TPA: DUF5829 family protein [Flavobacteriales bacterium]|nr:DUF5829 family protein [Flavobacteriales bacterium]HRE96933.1 DUF5829 family protein [Flavobacteriales bacterium]HRJ39799.1 DUF5829 family protein [Flavobacteriales bacterium]